MNLATTPGELYSLPPHLPLLDAVALDWLQRSPDPLQRANGLILLPTRRAARALAEAFLRAANGAPLLLPRITALGALDEAPLALAGALDLPPAVEPAQRLAALARLILALHGEDGAPRTADRAWLLARRTGPPDGRGGAGRDRPRRHACPTPPTPPTPRTGRGRCNSCTSSPPPGRSIWPRTA